MLRACNCALELAPVQTSVKPFVLEKLPVGALLDDLPSVDDYDPTGVTNRAEPMGDDEARAPLHEPEHCFLDVGFRPGVDTAGGFVEDQDGRAGKSRPGNGKELSVPLAQVGSLFGKQGLIPFGQAA
jgi:hypothetical protein